ncbi:MAG TPA: hypothetical protein VH374_20055 [Polyangia bacterium]|jgi:hypothetical protein|nr:hypothetical protein [Polyangia bacterium]
MKHVVILLGLALAAVVGGCGPKEKYCPQNGGPCFPPDQTPQDGAVDGDGGDGAVDAATTH